MKKFISAVLIFGLASIQAVTFAQSFTATSSVTMPLRLIPTSIVVTPATLTIAEGAPSVNLTATAQYDYPGLSTPIPPRDVTSDPLTVWSSADNAVALVNTVGLLTPVSDLGIGPSGAPVEITATYGGLTGVSNVRVTGVLPPTPTPTGGSGGNSGGSSSFGQPASPTQPTTQPTNNTNPQPPNVSCYLTGTCATTPSGSQTGSTGGQTGTGNTGTGTGTGSTPRNNVPVITEGRLPEEIVVPVELLPEEFTRPDEIEQQQDEILNEDDLGVERAPAVYRILSEKGLNVITLRRKLINKGLNDFNNLVNIFMSYTRNEDIKALGNEGKLKASYVKLFQDVKESNFTGGIRMAGLNDAVNIGVLGGVVNGYYYSDIEYNGVRLVSPFLPDRKVTRAELIKLIVTAMDLYDDSIIDTSYFYKPVYEKVLESDPANKGFTGAELIKQQKSPFVDVRPDLYDAHWYYPLAFNKACELGILTNCEGRSIDPDGNPTKEELQADILAARAYLDRAGLLQKALSDEDNDGIINNEENSIYFTNYLQKDTDTDSLNDGIELETTDTDPNKIDSDGDLLSDGDEVVRYKTNPNLPDTDDDKFTDWVEVNAGSNPLDKNSIPNDLNKNGIIDEWEQKYGLNVVDSSQDTDDDGISDLLEYRYGTNPLVRDSDGDGLTDGEEILDFDSNPLDKTDPGDSRDYPVKIVNYTNNQVIADSRPLVKGIAPASLGDDKILVQVVIRNEYGMERPIADTFTDQRGVFVAFPDIEIRDGTYFLMAKAVVKGDVRLSKPVKIRIDSKLQVANVKPEKLENKRITDDVLVNGLSLDVSAVDGRPVLVGRTLDLGSRVNLIWQSLTMSSAVVADAVSGEFAIKAPELEPGKHVVYIQAIRNSDAAVSKTYRVNFELDRSGKIKITDIAEGLLSGELGAADLQALAQKYAPSIGVFVVALITLLIGLKLFKKYIKKQ